MAEDRVIIFDTTLRDGEQAAGAAMTLEEKLEIARQLEKLRVDVIEAGFAASSPGDFKAVQTIAREVRTPIIASLARANPKDVDAAWEALKDAERPRIHVFISSSEIQVMHMMRKNREEIIEMAVNCVERARRYCSDVEFSAQDATRTQPEYLYQLLEAAIGAGATTVNIADTVGYMIPGEFAQLIRGVFEQVPNIHKARVSVHCHNDLGLAVANSLAAVQVGARQVEGCINGIGERAGNASIEEVVMALHTRRDLMGITTGVNSRQIYPTSRLVSRITGFPVQPNKAIVGENAFRHASGIHQDGVLKERTTYEIMEPQSIGWPGSVLVLGKLSGRAGLRARLEDLGYHLEPEELNQVFEEFKLLADKKREVTDRDLEALMSEQKRTAWEPNDYQLEHVQVSCGTNDIPTATVRIQAPDGAVRSEAATGNGPVDAVCKAIDRVVAIPTKLVEYRVGAVTEGLDSMAEVTIRVERAGNVYHGRGVSTDVIVASAKAYMSALNRLVATEGLVQVPAPRTTP
ncbi:MAG: 2-isopropylmalate synthase, partial [Dehalococcoidia bacterium]